MPSRSLHDLSHLTRSRLLFLGALAPLLLPPPSLPPSLSPFVRVVLILPSSILFLTHSPFVYQFFSISVLLIFFSFSHSFSFSLILVHSLPLVHYLSLSLYTPFSRILLSGLAITIPKLHTPSYLSIAPIKVYRQVDEINFFSILQFCVPTFSFYPFRRRFSTHHYVFDYRFFLHFPITFPTQTQNPRRTWFRDSVIFTVFLIS